MIVYVDARCLQDENFALRGVGYHSHTLLKHARKHNVRKLIAIIDEELPPLKDNYSILFDSTQPHSSISESPNQNESVIFLTLSPMTHPQWRFGPILEKENITSAAIIYDFIPLDSGNCGIYHANSTQKRAYTSNLLWLKKFDLYSSISYSTALKAKSILDINDESITITGCAIRDNFIQNNNNQSSTSINLTFEQHKYLICISGSDPRKNPEILLESIADINKSDPEIGLVIIGNINDYLKNHLNQKFKILGGDKNKLVFISGISDEDLKYLFKNALASINPSKNEGFSIPVIEAIAASCPSLASKIPAHQELLDESELFPIDSPKILTDMILNLIKNPDARKKIIEKQSPLIEKYKEPIVAEKFWNFLIRNKKNKFVQNLNIPNTLKLKPRIAFLTPFPPDRSGVADYTAKSLEEIGKLAVVDVFTDATSSKEFPGVRNIFPLSEKPFQSKDYDKVVSIIGNSHFHTEILKYHLRYGGACIQHDNRMAELYAWNMGHEKFAKKASELIKRKVEIAECQNWLKDPSLLPTLFLEDIIKKSQPLIFHSKVTQKLVKQMYGVDSEYLPFCLYRHFDEQSLSLHNKSEARKNLNIPNNEIIISTFGIVDDTKCPIDCIYAIYFLNKWEIPASLYFVGDPGPLKTTLLKLSEELGITNKIHLLESWISPEKYENFLLASDFAIQLRTFGFGGLSGAVLDCISAGVPTVVNNDLAESTNSPDYIQRINDHISALLIAESLYDGFQKQKHILRNNHERVKYIETHNFKKYAVNFMQILGF